MSATHRKSSARAARKRHAGAARRLATRTRGARSTDFAEALGASRSFAVESGAHGPFGAAALLRELRDRLVSRGGRPSDPAPTIRRLVPVRRQVWKDLQRHADMLSRHGGPVSPGQLAAILLEKSIASFEGSGAGS